MIRRRGWFHKGFVKRFRFPYGIFSVLPHRKLPDTDCGLSRNWTVTQQQRASSEQVQPAYSPLRYR